MTSRGAHVLGGARRVLVERGVDHLKTRTQGQPRAKGAAWAVGLLVWRAWPHLVRLLQHLHVEERDARLEPVRHAHAVGALVRLLHVALVCRALLAVRALRSRWERCYVRKWVLGEEMGDEAVVAPPSYEQMDVPITLPRILQFVALYAVTL